MHERPSLGMRRSEAHARSRTGALLVAALLGVGCGANGQGALTGEVGTYDPGPSFQGTDAAAGGLLDARIDQSDVAVQVVVVGCSGGCADIEAVATGGNPPYSFAWGDGPTSAARHVCPVAGTRYQVRVIDTGSTGEVPRPPQMASASVATSVLQCPDASDPGAALCLANGSFEGTPETVESFETIPAFEAPPWNGCESNNPTYADSTPDVVGPNGPGGLVRLAGAGRRADLRAPWVPAARCTSTVRASSCAAPCARGLLPASPWIFTSRRASCRRSSRCTGRRPTAAGGSFWTSPELRPSGHGTA